MKKVEKENKTTKEVVKSTKFANTIYSIRRDRNLTQKDLADLIGVSDRTISKWENGTTVPDLCQIRNICKKLEISPSLLIKSEKKFKDNMSFIKMKLGKALNYLIHNIFLIGFIIAFILLLIYFINNFNSVKIYDLKYDGDNIYLNHGYFFQTKTVNILTLENIALKKIEYEPTEIKLELYTLVNGDKKILYKADNLKNIYIEENKSNTDLLSKDTIENIKRNLYLTIETRDEQNKIYKYECQLAFKEKFNNNKLSYKTYVKDSNYETSILSTDNLSLFNNSYAPSNIPTDDVTSDKTIKTFSEHDTPENELEKLGYKYDEEKKTYTKKIDENTVIKNMISNGILIISNQINNHSEIIKYYYSTNRVNYSYSIKDNINIECFDYNVPDNLLNCIKGDCKNYHIKVNYILDVYRELTQTLQ
ncbi:dNA-binding helix-turn-helix protein [Firmicutes bacterium CAG:460]|nr:dNA-binding helix-turn-helix protein [Firmicutes bacterium CAG:460]